ncbi:MAG TPA: isochorismatase family protein [Myxococcales bacterium]|nr:isochorismatase family protein [Myxococcales bacterium]
MPSDAAANLVLDRETALLLVVDVQEKLARAMPPEAEARMEKNAAILIKAARRLGLPVVASEQYVKGLGPTVAAIRELLPSPPIEKIEFSCANSKALAGEVEATGRRQVIAVGMESHVCVFQTVRDLVGRGFDVFVPKDAIVSRTEENRQVGLNLCEKAGAVVTSTETVLFDLLRTAGTPEFKDLSPLIR